MPRSNARGLPSLGRCRLSHPTDRRRCAVGAERRCVLTCPVGGMARTAGPIISPPDGLSGLPAYIRKGQELRLEGPGGILSDLGNMRGIAKTCCSAPSVRDPRAQRAVRSSSDPTPPARRAVVVNAFTVDLEDWAYGLLGGETPITSRVVGNVERMLALLEQHNVKATFFALGKVCKKFPELLPRVAAGGHEIASHGYGHDLVYNMTPESFREDVRRSVGIIGEQTGAAPIGYRAPAFSITRQSLWAGPILAELGFKYSSSIFPIRGSRYGIADAPVFPFNWDDWLTARKAGVCGAAGQPEARSPKPGLIEFPMTTLAFAGRRWPVCGGGYLRLLPARFLKAAVRQAHRQGQPAVVYMHPYELDVSEVCELERAGWRFGRQTALTQSLFRCFIKRRLADIFRTFKFAPMREVLGVSELRR